MKLLLAALIFSISVSAQQFTSTEGSISFEASVPSFEEVKATSDKATCIINGTAVQASVAINSFEFRLPLMQEHFNEHYMESDKYPRAVLKGNLEKVVSPGNAPAYKIRGKLTLHGKTRKVHIPVQLKGDQTLEMYAAFTINLSDYAIKVPTLVKSKIAEQVTIRCRFVLVKVE